MVGGGGGGLCGVCVWGGGGGQGPLLCSKFLLKFSGIII